MSQSRCVGRGFTLIELLVVIAVIAILAAILFPALVLAKQRAQTSKCLSNLKQLAIAANQYATDNRGVMPPANHQIQPNWCGSTQSPFNKGKRWVYPERGSLWPFVKASAIYLCPSDKGIPATDNDIDPNLGVTKYPLSYSFNSALSARIPESLSFKNLSRVLLFIHEKRQREGSNADEQCINDGLYSVTGTQDLPSKVHYDGTTIVYLDTHAKWRSFKEMVKEQPVYWVPEELKP